jgi:hypothetical protein
MPFRRPQIPVLQKIDSSGQHNIGDCDKKHPQNMSQVSFFVKGPAPPVFSVI